MGLGVWGGWVGAVVVDCVEEGDDGEEDGEDC